MAVANNDNEHVRRVEELKSAFKEGATPNEKDYAALIDLAAVGSKALGATDKTPTTPNPGLGLKMDSMGKLTVSAGNGVTVDKNGVAVKGDEKSVTVSQTGVSIKVKEKGGLATDACAGLHVNTGTGLKTDGSGLEIKLADKSGLKADTDGLAVNVAAGLEVDSDGVLKAKVKAVEGNYITSGTDGLAITKEGVNAIEQALKSVSLEALQKADDATYHGFKVDATSAVPIDSVQKKIAEKLNAAFTEGWHLTQPREALFTALKQFRSANKAKIFKNGLIAPSAVTGKTGLYNQEGVEYEAGMVMGFRVSPAGVAEATTGGVYTEDGIYALVGKLDTAGQPQQGDTSDKVTQQALMVLVVQGVVTVVGHWDFKVEADWTGSTPAGGWRTGPGGDGVVKQMGDKKNEEYTKAAEQKYNEGLKQAAVAPMLGFNGKNYDLTATRTGNNLELNGTIDNEGDWVRVSDHDNFQEVGGNSKTSTCRIKFFAEVYGRRIESGTATGPSWSGHPADVSTDLFRVHDQGQVVHPVGKVKLRFSGGYLNFDLSWSIWPNTGVQGASYIEISMTKKEEFYFVAEGFDGIKTLLHLVF